MSFFPMLLVALIVVFVGALIGAIGIGGVLLVPLLTLALGIGVHVAIATASFTYLFTGIVGVVEYARRGTIRWSTVIWLCVGGMPGAYLGAMTAWHMPGPILEVIIGFLVLLSGFQSLRSRRETTVEQKRLIPSALFGIGIVTGFASAITGTGGPLVLVPILLWLKVPALTAVGLSQVIQIPIALLATGGNLTFGYIDFKLGSILAIMLMCGVIIGARIAHQVSKEFLKKLIAVALLMAGCAMLAKVAGILA